MASFYGGKINPIPQKLLALPANAGPNGGLTGFLPMPTQASVPAATATRAPSVVGGLTQRVAQPVAPPVRPVVPPQSAYKPTVKKATTNIKWKNVPPEKVAEAARRALMEKGQPGKTYAMGKLRGMGYSSAEAGKIISDAEKALQSAGKLPYTVKAKARQAAGRTAKPVGSQKNTVVTVDAVPITVDAVPITVDAVPTRSALSGEVLGSMQAEAKKVLKMFPNDVETGVTRAMEKLVYHGVPSQEAAQIIESLL